MPKALIYELGKSKSFGRLSLLAKVLWPMLLSTSDDQGRGEAEADTIKWYVCQNVPEITVDDVPRLLAEMAKQEMIRLYECDGVPVYQAIHWWEYQQLRWARPSKWAPPEGWTDRIRYSNRGDMHDNEGWYTTGGFNAEPLETAKTRSGKKAPDVPAENSTENCTEVPQKTVETSNLTQPNSTQPNPTEPNLTPSGQATAVLQASQPASLSLGDPPPPVVHKTMLPDEIPKADPVFIALWKDEVMPTLYINSPKAIYENWYLPITPIARVNGIAFLAVTEDYGHHIASDRLKKPIRRALSGVIGEAVDFQFIVLPPGGT